MQYPLSSSEDVQRLTVDRGGVSWKVCLVLNLRSVLLIQLVGVGVTLFSCNWDGMNFENWGKNRMCFWWNWFAACRFDMGGL